MDISGRIIFQKQIENISAGNLDLEIPAKGMNAGIYLVNLITELDNISGKVVKY
ncbi:MAG: T9SS type A sorting domain-containing protein [Bacteroidetes bacterium]|nr:T9SS type A sorting domain-containing protein [Bacteroidota bacterium]